MGPFASSVREVIFELPYVPGIRVECSSLCEAMANGTSTNFILVRMIRRPQRHETTHHTYHNMDSTYSVPRTRYQAAPAGCRLSYDMICILIRTYTDLTFYFVWGIRFVLVIVCISSVFICFFSRGILPLHSYWSLSCDHGLHCSDELMSEQQQQAYYAAAALNSAGTPIVLAQRKRWSR